METSKKSVLFITRHYLDENNGGSNGTKAYFRAIVELYKNVSLIYPEHLGGNSRILIPKGVKAIPCYDSRKLWKKGLDVYLGRLHRSIDYVKKHLAENKYDIIVIDHSLVANGTIKTIRRTGAKVITIHHNNESEYIKDNLPNRLFRIPFVYYTKKAERDALLLSDLNITVTEQDAQSFRAWYPNRDIHCYNMGTYQWQDIPKTIGDNGIRQCKTFAITGSLNFPQSQKPIIEFIDRYYSFIVQKMPGARLIIAGRNPSQNIVEACNQYKSIELIPNPEDIGHVIKEADVYICPINTGSGVKLRVMDGLKLGIPVLGHSISANGYESIKNDGYFFEYHDENSFESALDAIGGLKYNRQDVYDSFYRYFSFQAGKERLCKILIKENLYDNY